MFSVFHRGATLAFCILLTGCGLGTHALPNFRDGAQNVGRVPAAQVVKQVRCEISEFFKQDRYIKKIEKLRQKGTKPTDLKVDVTLELITNAKGEIGYIGIDLDKFGLDGLAKYIAANKEKLPSLGATVTGASEVTAKIDFQIPQAALKKYKCDEVLNNPLQALLIKEWLERFFDNLDEIEGGDHKLKAITLTTSFEIGIKAGANLNPFFGATYILPISGLVANWEPKAKHKLTIKINNSKPAKE